jgi:uncharacterized protein YdeI (BOF family)
MNRLILSLTLLISMLLVSIRTFSQSFQNVNDVTVEVPAHAEGAIRIKDVRRGQSVILHGVVSQIRDEDEFMLKDASGKIEIYLGRLGSMPVKVGDRVTVKGRADDDGLPWTRPDIYASGLILSDGRELQVQQWD